MRSWVIHWSEVAINASGYDHTPVAPGENRVFGEQIGPGRSARAMAIVQVAAFDSIIAVNGGFKSYTGLARVKVPTSTKAAVAFAAHGTLVALFLSQRRSFNQELMDSVLRLRGESPKAIANGILLGKRAAAAILRLRKSDGSHHKEPVMGVDHIPSDDPGHWRQDPISLSTVALGAHWGAVEPFVMKSGKQFRAPPPPAMTSAEYTEAFNEVKRLGGDGNPDTIADPNWMPLGAPGSNLNGPNFTPPFPTYPSGHGGFGGALFQILRRFYGTDEIAFTFVSDELNGTTRDNEGNVRPLRPRSFSRLSEAEEENGHRAASISAFTGRSTRRKP